LVNVVNREQKNKCLYIVSIHTGTMPASKGKDFSLDGVLLTVSTTNVPY